MMENLRGMITELIVSLTRYDEEQIAYLPTTHNMKG